MEWCVGRENDVNHFLVGCWRGELGKQIGNGGRWVEWGRGEAGREELEI